MIDLHTHTTFSDGTYSPEELVDYAIVKGLKALAITDHDTCEGVDRAISYAEKLKAQGLPTVEVIPGIEFSSENNGKDIHIVGLFVDYKDPDFIKEARVFFDSRKIRNIKMCDKFKEAGFDISYEELCEKFPGAIITRAHFARLLFEKGYVKSIKEAFDRYIGDNGPLYVHREKAGCDEAIRIILKAGGIPILAHPTLYHLSHSSLDELIQKLIGFGLMGMETKYTTFTQGEETEMLNFAHKYRLLSSGGSDFHGANKPLTDLAVGHGSLYIHDEFLDKLKGAEKKILFTDMDGTLLNNDSLISDSMREGLNKLVEGGNYLVLTSGRPLESIRERVKTLNLSEKNLMIIADNGGVIYDVAKDTIIKEEKLSCDLVAALESIGNKLKVHLHGYTDKEIVVYSEDEELKFYRRRIHMPFVETDSMAKYLKPYEGSNKILFIDLSNHELLEAAKKEITETLGDKLDAMFSNDRYLEVIPKGISKGNAIEIVRKYLNIHPNNTFASGDEENDISMIKAAHTGVAMLNGRDSVKEAADIVTSKTNNEDGLLEIINTYFL